jgi:predicted amidohydrolase
MKTLTVGGCRIPVSSDIQANLTEIKKAIDWAADNSVEIMCTPECALSGYMWRPESQKDPRVIELSSAIDEIKKHSKEKKVDLVLGTAWYNLENEWTNIQAFIIDGECQEVYYKNVLFGKELIVYRPGNDITVFNYKNFKISGLICNDLWSNPMFWPGASAQLLQKLMIEQVDVVFLSANVPRDTTHNDLFYQWHETTCRMFSGTGRWNMVVCDIGIDDSRKLCPVGIIERNSMWAAKGHDSEPCYFKHTIN